MWVIFPYMEFENETVYNISFERKHSVWGEVKYEIVYGDSPEPEALNNKAFDIENPTGWDYERCEGLMVLTTRRPQICGTPHSGSHQRLPILLHAQP